MSIVDIFAKSNILKMKSIKCSFLSLESYRSWISVPILLESVILTVIIINIVISVICHIYSTVIVAIRNTHTHVHGPKAKDFLISCYLEQFVSVILCVRNFMIISLSFGYSISLLKRFSIPVFLLNSSFFLCFLHHIASLHVEREREHRLNGKTCLASFFGMWVIQERWIEYNRNLWLFMIYCRYPSSQLVSFNECFSFASSILIIFFFLAKIFSFDYCERYLFE